MKRFLLCCSLAVGVVFPVAAQEKKDPDPKKAAETKKGDKEPSKEPAKSDPAKSDPKSTDKAKTGDPPKAASDGKPRLELEIVNLYNPCGVAIQPKTGHVFVADSGHLRILRYKPADSEIAQEVVQFTKDVYGKGPMYDIGPLGLAFLNEKLLVVGGGGHVDGQELIYIFDVSQPRRQEAKNAKHKIGPIGPTPGKTEKGEGNFYALAYHEPTTVFFSTNGDDTKGWVAKLTVKDNTPDEKLELAIPTKEYTGEVDAPVGITMSPDKKLVIGQMGEVSGKGKDSLLLIYDPNTGKPVAKAETGLYDIAALAYHPKSGNLYALDYAWQAPNEGGLFRLHVSGEGADFKVKAERVTYGYEAGKDAPAMPFAGEPSALDKPTAMAFDASGNLYITLIGTAKEKEKDAKKAKPEDEKRPGRLVKISGLP
jgi:hypothetical protein